MPRIPQAISEDVTSQPMLPSPIAPKEGLGLLDRLSLIEWAVQSAIIGDNGPLTSSPNQRRNMSLVFADVAGQLTALAKRIDPLSDPVTPDKVTPFIQTRSKGDHTDHDGPYKCSECHATFNSVESVLIHKSHNHASKP